MPQLKMQEKQFMHNEIGKPIHMNMVILRELHWKRIEKNNKFVAVKFKSLETINK